MFDASGEGCNRSGAYTDDGLLKKLLVVVVMVVMVVVVVMVVLHLVARGGQLLIRRQLQTIRSDDYIHAKTHTD